MLRGYSFPDFSDCYYCSEGVWSWSWVIIIIYVICVFIKQLIELLKFNFILNQFKKNPHFSVPFSMAGMGIDFDADDFKNQYADYYNNDGRTAKPSQYDYKWRGCLQKISSTVASWPLEIPTWYQLLLWKNMMNHYKIAVAWTNYLESSWFRNTLLDSNIFYLYTIESNLVLKINM